jgi:hypothetical protein
MENIIYQIFPLIESMRERNKNVVNISFAFKVIRIDYLRNLSQTNADVRSNFFNAYSLHIISFGHIERYTLESIFKMPDIRTLSALCWL